MNPLDLIKWSLAILVSVGFICVASLIIGDTIAYIKRNSR